MDKDISRQAVERAASTLMRVRRSMRDTIPYGPSKVHMTSTELRKALQGARPDALQQLVQYMGPEKAIQMLIGARQRTPSLEQFIQEQHASS